MPALANPKHEAFCQAIAKGKTAGDAYLTAGYECVPHKARGHGHRLRTRPPVDARIEELTAGPHRKVARQQIVEAIRVGRPTEYRVELCAMVKRLALLGMTEPQMAEVIEVPLATFEEWQRKHPEFSMAMNRGKAHADAKVAQSLYRRANGARQNAVKIFLPAGADTPVIVPYVEEYPPDTGAAKMWLTNRQPALWRDRREYDISAGSLEAKIAAMTREERRARIRELAEEARRMTEDEAQEVIPPEDERGGIGGRRGRGS